ncbi:hypothetical protein AGMMS50212_02350 [Spirochaetia bacterium]|nr:hypothetical protein AGMMS50212_02350 [Spirochaetia bacterium]
MKYYHLVLAFLISAALFVSCSQPDTSPPNTGAKRGGTAYTGSIGAGLSLTTAPPVTAVNNDTRSFIVTGTVQNTTVKNYAAIIVLPPGTTINDVNSDNRVSTYFVRGDNFTQEVTLRHGIGDYTVVAAGLISINANLDGDGAINSYSFDGDTMREYTVTNSYASSKNTDWEILAGPSTPTKSNSTINNLLNTVLSDYGINMSATDEQKVKAINRWMVINMEYDFDSLAANRYKKMDSMSVLSRNGLAVCDGYANLFASLARSAGLRVRCVVSIPMVHAWNNVYVGGAWKFVDVTWNDVSSNYTNNTWNTVDLYNNNIAYTEQYLMLNDLNGIGNDHANGRTDDRSRTVTNYPDTIYNNLDNSYPDTITVKVSNVD